MRFPSLSSLYQSFVDVIKRFPVPAFFALLGTICGMLLVDTLFAFGVQNNLFRLVYTAIIGLALSLAIKLYQEQNLKNKAQLWLAYGSMIFILITVFFTFDPFFKRADILAILIIAFAAHLLVSLAAFFKKSQAVGFWQINKSFFLRFATSGLYSAVLFIGLSVALFSIDELFKVEVNGAVYGRLWVFIVGIFNTIFFLADLPGPSAGLNHQKDYPRGLKVFTQFVLIPLASVYLLILLAYELKILLDFQLPNSSVALLILGYAVFGMLSVLLVHPLKDQQGNAWIKWYSKRFYLMMLPLLALLILSIYKRTSDYGITESRYVLIALCIWLCFITAFFLIKGQQQIRVIPMSLLVICVLAVMGPWRITAVSKRSQQARLKGLLTQQKSNQRDDEIRNLVHYLYDSHGLLSLQSFVKTDLGKINNEMIASADTVAPGGYHLKWQSRDTVLTMLNVSKSSLYIPGEAGAYKGFLNQDQNVLDVSGALRMISFDAASDTLGRRFTWKDKKYDLKIDDQDFIRLNNEIVFRADTALKTLLMKHAVAGKDRIVVLSQELTFPLSYRKARFKIIFSELHGGYSAGKPKASHYSGFILFFGEH